MLQTISLSLKVKFRLTQHNKLHSMYISCLHNCQVEYGLCGDLIAFVHLCYMDRCHLWTSYKTAKLPLYKSQFNSYMANAASLYSEVMYINTIYIYDTRCDFSLTELIFVLEHKLLPYL